MAIELVCSCGRVLRFSEPPVGGQACCPACQALVTIELDRPMPTTASEPALSAAPPAATRKPLWEVMGRGQNIPAIPQQPSDSAAAFVPDSPETVSPATEKSSQGPGRKGLWSVMQTSAAEATPAIGPHLGDDSPGSPEADPSFAIQNPDSETSVPLDLTFDSDSRPDSLAAMIGITTDEAVLSAQSKAVKSHAANSRRAIVAAVLGGASIPLSGLALINAAWSQLPATALGFVAILTGLIASQEIQRSGGRKTGRRMAIAGIVTGILGSFLGPVVIAPLGRPRRRR